MSGENKGNQNSKVKDNKVNENDVSVEEELQWEIDQIDEAEKEIWEDAKVDIVPLLNKIKELEDQLQEKDEIAKNSQINYLHLKADFDILQRQTQQKVENAERDALMKVVKEFLPFIENLRKSLINLSDEQKASSMGEWLALVYDSFIKSLEKLHIKPIDALWLEPDPKFHEPVTMQPVEDENLKWKIIQEFQQWFIYETEEEQIVIQPAKVIVWN